jgi:flagellin
VKKGVVLVADDGRNISVGFDTLTDAKTGVSGGATVAASKVYTGTYQLASTTSSPITIGVSSNGTLSNAGLTAGSYTANVSAMATVDRAVTAAAADIKQLNAGDLRINGTAIVASSTADDTATDTTAVSSTKAASAIAIAAAINKASTQTGVTATAAANTIVGTSFTAGTYDTEEMYINGTTIDLSSLDTLGHTATRSDVADLINQYTGQTGVTASDNGRGLTLVAADGRNVSLGTTLTAADLGVDSGAIKAAAADATEGKTTYARVVLQSDKSFTLEGGSDGNANFELLGFKTGTYGGVDNGVKVAQIDISTQAGAQVALTALDSALKSVSLNQAKLGAFQNRLDAVVANLTEVNQNMSASRSRIQDTDYATETTNLAKSQIIQQAATAMLAQANQSSQSVLSLLK